MKVNNLWQGLDSTEFMIIWEGAKNIMSLLERDKRW